MKTLIIALIALVTALGALVPKLKVDDQSLSLGSAPVGESYNATTTGQVIGIVANAKEFLLKNGSGQLGSVVVTGANTGNLEFYDATTSNATLRFPGVSTSTIFLGHIPQSAVANTYVFDIVFSTGLLLVTSDAANTLPTTTITWK